jgi:hypothetical protein
MSGEARVLTHLVGPTRERTWLTVKQLTAYGAFPSTEACRQYVKRHLTEILVARRGRLWLIDQGSFDRHVEQRGLRPPRLTTVKSA